MGLSERMEPKFPNKYKKKANTDNTDSDRGIREIIPGAPCPCPCVHIHVCRCAHAYGVPRTTVHTYVQVYTCVWSPEDSCAYIRAGVRMHVEP